MHFIKDYLMELYGFTNAVEYIHLLDVHTCMGLVVIEALKQLLRKGDFCTLSKYLNIILCI